MAASVKTDVFISYAWSARKQAVYRMVDAIRQANFTLWLDVEKMAGSVQKAMTQGIDAAKVVLLFYSEPYFKSANCKIEAEHAQKSGKTIIIVSMQKNFTPKEWLANILKGRQKPIDFSDETNFWQVANQIVSRLQRVKKIPQQTLHPKLKKSINIPRSYCKYFERELEQGMLESTIYRLCSSRRAAAVAVNGMAGVGKSTLVQHFLSSDEEFLAGRCGIHYVAWMNVIHHRPDKPYNEEGFVKDLCDLLKAAGIQFDRAEIGIQLSKIGQLIDQYMPCRSDTFLLVLDDVFDVNVLDTIINKIQSANLRIITISRDQDRLTTFVPSDNFVDIGLLDESSIRQILKANLKVKVPDKTISWLAGHCHGLPIVVSLVTVHLGQLNEVHGANMKKVMDELKFDLEEQPGSMHVTAAERTLTRLMQRNLAMESQKLAKCYETLLFFDPGMPVEIGDIAVMWRCGDVENALEICMQFCRKSLLMPAGKTAATGEFRFSVHELLRDAGVRFVLGKSRTKAVVDFQNFQSRFVTPGVLRRCVDNKRHSLLLHIIAHCQVELLSKLCENQDDFDPNHNRKTFLQYLYESGQNGWRESLGDGINAPLVNSLAEAVGPLFSEFVSNNLPQVQQLFSMWSNEMPAANPFVAQSADLFKAFMCDPSAEGLNKLFSQSVKSTGGFTTEKNIAMDLLFRLVRRLHSSHVDVIRMLKLPDAFSKSPWQLILKDRNDTTFEAELVKYFLMGIEAQQTENKENHNFYQLPPEPEDIRVKTAIGQCLDVSDKTKEMYHLVASGDYYKMERFLKQQPDVEICYKITSTHDLYDSPLQLAAANGLPEICRLLWSKCAGAIDRRDMTAALAKAVERGHYETTEFLIKIGADVNAATGDTSTGDSPLFLAAQYGYLDIIKLLKASGADLGKANKQGITAASMAAVRGRIDIVNYLQENGVSVNVHYPTMKSSEYGEMTKNMEELLTELGSDLQIDETAAELFENKLDNYFENLRNLHSNLGFN